MEMTLQEFFESAMELTKPGDAIGVQAEVRDYVVGTVRTEYLVCHKPKCGEWDFYRGDSPEAAIALFGAFIKASTLDKQTDMDITSEEKKAQVSNGK
jgi:hypothetical protein